MTFDSHLFTGGGGAATTYEEEVAVVDCIDYCFILLVTRFVMLFPRTYNNNIRFSFFFFYFFLYTPRPCWMVYTTYY